MSAALALPKRSGERPATHLGMPHQQLDQIAPAALQEELWRRMTELEHVTPGRSGVSLPQSRAVHLDPAEAAGPPTAFLVRTEFAHIHGDFDGSLHAALPEELAEAAIEKGWAELHPLAREGIAPKTMVMLYGPRDEEELETVWQLVQASYAFARGQS
jgi:hypothetical protein